MAGPTTTKRANMSMTGYSTRRIAGSSPPHRTSAGRPEQFAHATQRARDDREVALIKAQATADLIERGYIVLDREPSYYEAGVPVRLSELVTVDGARVTSEDIADTRFAVCRRPPRTISHARAQDGHSTAPGEQHEPRDHGSYMDSHFMKKRGPLTLGVSEATMTLPARHAHKSVCSPNQECSQIREPRK